MTLKIASTPNYIVWYQKKIQAKIIKEAVQKEMKIKSKFYSLLEDKESDVEQVISAIGFDMSNK